PPSSTPPPCPPAWTDRRATGAGRQRRQRGRQRHGDRPGVHGAARPAVSVVENSVARSQPSSSPLLVSLVLFPSSLTFARGRVYIAGLFLTAIAVAEHPGRRGDGVRGPRRDRALGSAGRCAWVPSPRRPSFRRRRAAN